MSCSDKGKASKGFSRDLFHPDDLFLYGNLPNGEKLIEKVVSLRQKAKAFMIMSFWTKGAKVRPDCRIRNINLSLGG